jgi:hypothetical protein
LNNVRSVPSLYDGIRNREQISIVVDFGVRFVVKPKRIFELKPVVQAAQAVVG